MAAISSPSDADIEDVVPVWTLGERIAKVRKLLALEQAELATILDVSPPAISKWETDRGRPRDVLDLAQRLEDLTAERGQRVSAGWVLGVRTGSR